MEEVSAEKLANRLAKKLSIFEVIKDNPFNLVESEEKVWAEYTEFNDCPFRFREHLITQAINKATEAKNRELEAACRQLEFTNNFLKTHMDTGPSRQLVMDNQALIDQIRLER